MDPQRTTISVCVSAETQAPGRGVWLKRSEPPRGCHLARDNNPVVERRTLGHVLQGTQAVNKRIDNYGIEKSQSMAKMSMCCRGFHEVHPPQTWRRGSTFEVRPSRLPICVSSPWRRRRAFQDEINTLEHVDYVAQALNHTNVSVYSMDGTLPFGSPAGADVTFSGLRKLLRKPITPELSAGMPLNQASPASTAALAEILQSHCRAASSVVC